jgi:hypothetical protein
MTDKFQRVSTLKEAKALGCLIQRFYLDRKPDKKGRLRYVYDFYTEKGTLLGMSKIVTQKASSLIWRNDRAYYLGTDGKLHGIVRSR